MAKSDAGVELAKLAPRHGFHEVATHRRTVMYANMERRESFSITVDESGAFESASWAGPQLWKTVVDKRAPGEHSARSGESLAANSKRRAVGMSEVRAVLVRDPYGLDVGYMDLKRRIKDKDWIK